MTKGEKHQELAILDLRFAKACMLEACEHIEGIHQILVDCIYYKELIQIAAQMDELATAIANIEGVDHCD